LVQVRHDPIDIEETASHVLEIGIHSGKVELENKQSVRRHALYCTDNSYLLMYAIIFTKQKTTESINNNWCLANKRKSSQYTAYAIQAE